MHITADVFPAHFTVAKKDVYDELKRIKAYPPLKSPDVGYISKTRVLIANLKNLEKPENDLILVVASDSPDGPQIMFQERIESFSEDSGTYRALTVSGKMVAFELQSNCGCGSRLRSWNPYKTLSSIKD
jgi:hypothetical protein